MQPIYDQWPILAQFTLQTEGFKCLGTWLEFSYVHTHDFHGYHRSNCKHHAGKANRAAHDLIQQAIKKEFQRQGLHVVDNDNDMSQRFFHLSSQKRGDLAILSDDCLIYDQVRKQPLSQVIADIQLFHW